MEAAPVIKGLDKIEDGQASLVPGFETAAVDELQFEGAPEGFHGGVVITAGFAAHRGLGLSLGQGLSKIRASVLAAAIGVENELWRRLAVSLRHVPSRQDQ